MSVSGHGRDPICMVLVLGLERRIGMNMFVYRYRYYCGFLALFLVFDIVVLCLIVWGMYRIRQYRIPSPRQSEAMTHDSTG